MDRTPQAFTRDLEYLRMLGELCLWTVESGSFADVEAMLDTLRRMPELLLRRTLAR